jgi:hypothetical protein
VLGSIDHRPVKDGSEVTVRLTVRNDTPATGLNSFVQGPYPYSNFVAGEYSGLLAVNVPQVSRDVSLTGGGKIVAAGPDGPTRVLATEIQLLRGEQKQYVLKFVVPTGYQHLTVEPSARYPTVTWVAGGKPWHDDAPRTVGW